jgi:hypothetical protein
MEQSVNYIVAVYGGKRRAYSNFAPIELFIDTHISFLDKKPKYISSITFVFNKSDNPKEGELINKCEEYIQLSGYGGCVIVRDNICGSYGAWNDALIESHSKSTHSFLIEDDYIPADINFIEYFLKKDKPNVSFVASYFHDSHASISNGLINNTRVLETLNNKGSLFRLIGDNEYGGGLYHTQYQYLRDIEGEITDITDIGYTVFYTPEKNINYTNDSLTKLIEPIIEYEMKSNYLVVFSAHVDSENKKNETIETLRHLKESNIDVCLSTHSNLYLDELSQYAKYVIYDANNEFLFLQDYIDNSEYLDKVSSFGESRMKTSHSFGKLSVRIPGSPHSKCALSLLKNGIMVSGFNNYKWTIYLEYDIKIPKLGFKHFFDHHINSLVESGKKCFYYYMSGYYGLKFLWGGTFVVETDSIFAHEKFMKNDWYSNKQNWIKEWQKGFFESIIEYTIKSSFNEDEIISETIDDNFKKFWDIDDFSKLGKFYHTDTFSNSRKYLTQNFKINLYPHIDNEGNRKLFLYFYNGGDKKVDLAKISVRSDDVLHIDEQNKIVHEEVWFLLPIEIDGLTDNDTVFLSWTGSIENESYGGTQSIRIGDLENVYNNIMNIEFGE